jgi:hypothetical protein
MESELTLNEDFLRADDLIRDNKISEALKLLESIILEDPGFGKAHNHIGWIYETKLSVFYQLCLFSFQPRQV